MRSIHLRKNQGAAQAHKNNSNEAFEESHRSTITKNESSDRKRTPLLVPSPTRRGKLTKEQRRFHPFARRTKPNLNPPTPRTPAAAAPSEKRRGTKASNRRRFVPSPPGFQSLAAPPAKNFICRRSEPSPPAEEAPPTAAGGLTLAPPPTVDEVQNLGLGRNLPNLYTAERRFDDPSPSLMPERPPERRITGVGAGSDSRLGVALSAFSLL